MINVYVVYVVSLFDEFITSVYILYTLIVVRYNIEISLRLQVRSYLQTLFHLYLYYLSSSHILNAYL
jgi:hypothetical protein